MLVGAIRRGPFTRYVAAAVFAVAFGIEEAIIVLYLRRLPASAAVDSYHLEIGREACTLVVLAAVSIIAGETAARRLRYFLFSFGIWDLTYYAALYWSSGQPRMTSDDVLFLIPVPWIGPVWAVVAFAFLLALVGALGIAPGRGRLLIAGLTIGLISFIYGPVTAVAHTPYPLWLFVPAIALVIAALPIAIGRRTSNAGHKITRL